MIVHIEIWARAVDQSLEILCDGYMQPVQRPPIFSHTLLGSVQKILDLVPDIKYL